MLYKLKSCGGAASEGPHHPHVVCSARTIAALTNHLKKPARYSQQAWVAYVRLDTVDH